MSEVINNRENRIKTMRTIIERLHAGADPEEVRAQLRELVQETDGSEIAAMEQQLISDGMPAEKIRSMCDLHAQVLEDITVEAPTPETQSIPGHPLETFRRENDALLAACAAINRITRTLDADAGSYPEESRTAMQAAVNELMDVEKHYARKENLLFPFLEKRGITGPSQVMWAKDDEARDLLKQAHDALRNGTDGQELYDSVRAATSAIVEMVRKETNILLPMSAETLTEEEWGEIWAGSPEYGWCLVEPGEEYSPPESETATETVDVAGHAGIALPNGSLTLEQLTAILGTTPVDMTFIDADDRVAWFSHGGGRVFARSKTILGRKVQHCHPPRSVDVVDRIVDDFRNGRQDVAEFWIEMKGSFIHIRYFAVRNPEGTYLGTLEVTQDVTHIRALEGERRLLSYD